MNSLKPLIEQAWQEQNILSNDYQGPHRSAVLETLQQLDSGTIRVAEKIADGWHIYQWVKEAILLAFRSLPM